MKIKLMCNRTPTLDDFSQEEQNFMKDFVRATLPEDPMLPAVRRTFWMVEKLKDALQVIHCSEPVSVISSLFLY